MSERKEMNSIILSDIIDELKYVNEVGSSHKTFQNVVGYGKNIEACILNEDYAGARRFAAELNEAKWHDRMQFELYPDQVLDVFHMQLIGLYASTVDEIVKKLSGAEMKENS